MAVSKFHNYTPFTAQSAASAFDNKSNPTNVIGLNDVSLIINWTDSALRGTVTIYASNDQNANPAAGIPVVNWSALTFDSSITLDGSFTDACLTLKQNPFKWLAIGWAPSAGAGTMTIEFNAKGLS